jgi:integrase
MAYQVFLSSPDNLIFIRSGTKMANKRADVPKELKKPPLSVGKIDRILRLGKPGFKPYFFPDGNGLHLKVGGTGAASWQVRYTPPGNKSRTWTGLTKNKFDPRGDIKTQLDDARRECLQIQLDIKIGKDPKDEKKKQYEANEDARLKSKTFKYAAEEFLEQSPHFQKLGDETKDQWRVRLKDRIYPIIGQRLVNDIGPAAVIEVMHQPYSWRDKIGRFDTVAPVAAEGCRMYIATILKYAQQKEYRDREDFNPGDRKNINLSVAELEKPKRKDIDYHEVPPFVLKLREYQVAKWSGGGSERSRLAGVAATLLIMLTATRIGQALQAKWVDIDTKKGIWKVDNEDMKQTKAEAQRQPDSYKIPLSPQAVELLESLPREGKYVFVGRKTGIHLSRGPIDRLMTTLGLHLYTPHDFRRFFSTWANEQMAGERKRFDEQVIEHCLTHLKKRADAGDVAYIYNRSEQVELRRQVYNAWAGFCYPPAGGGAEIIQLQKHG